MITMNDIIDERAKTSREALLAENAVLRERLAKYEATTERVQEDIIAVLADALIADGWAYDEDAANIAWHVVESAKLHGAGVLSELSSGEATKTAKQTLVDAFVAVLSNAVTTERVRVIDPLVAHSVAKMSWDRGEAEYWDEGNEASCREFDPTITELDTDDCDRGAEWLEIVTEILADTHTVLGGSHE